MQEGPLVGEVPVGSIRCHPGAARHFTKYDGGRPAFPGKVSASCYQRAVKVAVTIGIALPVRHPTSLLLGGQTVQLPPNVNTVNKMCHHDLMHRIEALPDDSLRTRAFVALLRDAAGQEDQELHRLIADVLPVMATIGVLEDAEPVAFASYRAHGRANMLEYLAVRASHRGRGAGTALIRFIRAEDPGMPLIAETDDDAAGFYHRLGFTVETAPPDPRWPGRLRYRCTLPPLSAA